MNAKQSLTKISLSKGFTFKEKMTDKEIQFFFSLKKTVKRWPFIIAMIIGLFVLNGLFQFLPFIDVGASFGISAVLIPNFLLAWLKVGTDSSSHDLIEKLINRDAVLIRHINEYQKSRIN